MDGSLFFVYNRQKRRRDLSFILVGHFPSHAVDFSKPLWYNRLITKTKSKKWQVGYLCIPGKTDLQQKN